MSFCEKCGKEINEGASFCSYCGAPQKPIIQEPVTANNEQANVAPEQNQIFIPPYQAEQTNQNYQSSQTNQSNTTENAQYYTNTTYTNTTAPAEEDVPSTGYNILSFLVPIAGLILYLDLKDKFPKKANSCGKWALISVIAGVVLSIFSSGCVACIGILSEL